jgi:ferritin-like metal-binding protein YciE
MTEEAPVAHEVQDQLTGYLSDAHAIEEQALAQLRSAPGIAGQAELAKALAEHCVETEQHERLVRERLAELGDSPSRLKDMIMALGGKGFVLFARAQPDTPGKLAAHAYSYEHLELAAYQLLARAAAAAGDSETEEMAQQIALEEKRMGVRLSSLFTQTVEASLEALEPGDLQRQVVSYLTDAHALELQSVGLLERAVNMAGDRELTNRYEKHLAESRRHAERVEARLKELDATPSRLKDTAMWLGAVNWSTFFRAHPDTPGKLAAFAYAFEHLEIAGYEQLAEVAERAGDGETVRMAEEIGEEERQAAKVIAELWSVAAHASMREVRT